MPAATPAQRLVIISYVVCTKTNPGGIPSLQTNAGTKIINPYFGLSKIFSSNFKPVADLKKPLALNPNF